MPETPAPDPLDVAACRALLRTGSRSFFAASLLLPRSVRASATVLYAFCRIADDGVDECASGRPLDAVEHLRRRLDAVYGSGTPHAPADRALAAVVARHGIPRALPDALLDGLAWDATGRRYESLDDLCDYAARVAGSVGAMMALLMGVRSAGGLARACDLGVAMQLTNIARDVGADAAMGRLYLPCAWLREAGMDPDAWLRNPAFSPALGSVVQRLLLAADALYDRVDEGIAQLPLACRPGITVARYLYADIGGEVRRRGLDSVSGRAVVPASGKLRLLARALTSVPVARTHDGPPALPATHYLVQAAAAADAGHVDIGSQALTWWQWRRRMLWVIDLFERLEVRERTQARAPAR